MKTSVLLGAILLLADTAKALVPRDPTTLAGGEVVEAVFDGSSKDQDKGQRQGPSQSQGRSRSQDQRKDKNRSDNGSTGSSPTSGLGACASGMNMVSFTGYQDCRGSFGGNINGHNTGEVGLTGVLNGFGGAWAGNWRLVGNSGGAPDGWFDGSIDRGVVDYLNFDVPMSGWFVVGVKQANLHSFYLYQWDNQVRTALDWRGVAPGNAGYSHVNLYTVDGGPYVPQCDDDCYSIPESASLSLLATGLVGLGAVARRRRRDRT